jgi:hypothetical protein
MARVWGFETRLTWAVLALAAVQFFGDAVRLNRVRNRSALCFKFIDRCVDPAARELINRQAIESGSDAYSDLDCFQLPSSVKKPRRRIV